MKPRILKIMFSVGLMNLTLSAGAAQTLSLDGEWSFAVDTSGAFTAKNVKSLAQWRMCRVPLSWQAQFDDLRDYQGVAWYRKTFSLKERKKGPVALLHFGAVDYLCRVYVNGHLAGEHEGGYTPFAFEVSGFLRTGNNEILVRVMDPIGTDRGTEGISLWHIPRGKQSWYVQTSGIWRSVELQIRPHPFLRRIQCTPTIDGKVEVALEIVKDRNRRRETLALRIFGSKGTSEAETQRVISSNEDTLVVELHVKNPKLWSLETPHLYELEAVLSSGDRRRERFGFRSFETKEGKFFLNGEPIYLMGALDQDFYPETIYSTPSEEYLRDEMTKAKRLGLNLLRCHIKVPDPLYLKVADEIGLLVWCEIPNWDVFTPDAARRGSETFTNMLKRDWNHPSLVIMSLINESWGIDLQKPDQRSWLKTEFERAKALARGRLVVDNSACWGNFHLKTDINDYHTYWAIPEHRKRFDETVDAVAARPKWLWSGSGDAEESGTEPLMISEFGNWGLPQLPEQLPWWFGRDFLGRTVTLPAGVFERFSDHGYKEIFGSYNRLAELSQDAQFDALKYEIEQIRRSAAIQGYVITEFTDINWESNGLLDMWRNFKGYASPLADIQQPDILIPRVERFTIWSGEQFSIRLWLSHFSSRTLRNTRLVWSTSAGSRGEADVPEIGRGEVRELPSLRLSGPIVTQARHLRVDFELRDIRNQVLARNFCELFVYPMIPREGRATVSVHELKGALQTLAQPVPASVVSIGSPTDSTLPLLTTELDETVMQALRRGRTVVCLVDTGTVLPSTFPLQLVRRESEWYDGNWATNFNWVRTTSPLWKNLATRSRLGFEAAHASPRTVLSGIPTGHFTDVLAGMFVGGVHLNSGYIVQVRASAGKLLLCTMPIAESAATDPFSAWLVQELIRYGASAECAPRFEWKIQ